MKTRSLLLSAIAIFTALQLSGQTRAETREMFNQGEMYVLFEEYNEALPFYLDLVRLFPDNSNFKYRVGQCYLNIPGEKEKAMPYLEEAVKNIGPKHKQGRLREETAPFDALYYLANAYRVNNMLEEAIETYERFLENMDHNIYDSTIVRFQLQTCHNAKQMMASPLYVKQHNLGEIINERFSETNPVYISGSNSLFFSRKLQLRTALFQTKITDGRWAGPVDIIPDLNVDDKFYPTSATKDGKTLFLYSDFDFIGNIYVSRYIDDRWTAVEKLNENVNTKYWESHASISPDGNRLYFSSNRKGGYGGLDIYYSELDTAGNWGAAINMGPVINTPYHEDTPFITDDGKTLFFSSRGHYNMGGYDIFYSSRLDDTTWSEPLNAGYPLNTTDDDLFFVPVGKGYEGYIARFDDRGFGGQDIFRVEIFSDDHPRRFIIRGISRIEDLRSDLAERIRLVIKDLNDPNIAIIVYTDPATGQYEFEVKHGDYEITFDADGVVKEVKRLTLPLDHPGDNVAIGLTELQKTDFEADLRVLTDSLIRLSKTDTVVIPLYTEPNSILNVVVMNEGKALVSENFATIDTSFVFRFLPAEGINVVDFRLTDKFSNIARARVIVEMGSARTAETIARPERARVIADRQVAAFLEILKQNADEDLRDIISGIDPKKQKFGNIDDVVSYIRELAMVEGIGQEKIDRLVLKTAVNNNILTQAAVDYLERNARGELRDILSAINVYDLKLRSWGDLRDYVTSKEIGIQGGEELDKLARFLLTGQDPSIAVIREKISQYATPSEKKVEIMEALSETDARYITNAGEWLEAFHGHATGKGLTGEELALLYSATGFSPDAEPMESLSQLRKHAPASFGEYLDKLDFRKLKIRSNEDILNYLIGSIEEFDSRELFTALAATIAENDLPAATVTSPRQEERGSGLRIILPIFIVIIVLIIILLRRRNEKGKR